MRAVAGTFNGTGADLYLCIGFFPDEVIVRNLEGTAEIMIEWNRAMMGTVEVAGGINFVNDGTATEKTRTTGIIPFYGGTSLTSTLQSDTTYGGGVYLKRDNRDYRYGPNLGPGGYSGDGSSDTVTTWTLGSASNYTGNFNTPVAGTYIGEGSDICIDGKWYKIQGISSNGEQANEVTLSHPAPSGTIEHISGMYGYKPMAVNSVTLDGFEIVDTAVNVDDAICWFRAIQWD